MALRTWLYIAGIFGVIILYTAFKINALFLLGYLIILLIADFVPKSLIIESILAAGLFGGAIFAVSSGATSYAPLLIAFLLVLARLPGTVLYTGVTLGLSSISAVSTVSYISSTFLILIIAINVGKFLLERVFRVAFYIPFVNILPILIDIGINALLIFLLFSSITPLASSIQGLVNSLVSVL